MGSEARPSSSSSTVLIVIVVVVVMLVMFGILVLGLGALFYVRAESGHALQRAQMAQMEAVEQAARARAEFERSQAVVDQTPSQSLTKVKPPSRQIVISLDAEGQLTMDGQATASNDLRGLLQKAQQGQTNAVSVTIEADGRCPFQQVADVQTLCRELGIQAVELKAVKPAGKDAESKRTE